MASLLHSDNVPSIPFQIKNGEMAEVFRNFTFNWEHIMPVVTLLIGIIFGFYVLRLLKERFVDDD